MRKTYWLGALGANAAAGALSLAAASHLPDPFPIHWDANGQPNGFAPLAIGLSLIPVMGVLITGLLAVITRFAKPETAKDLLAKTGVATATFMFGIHGLTLYAATTPGMGLSLGPFMVLMGGFFAALGWMLRDVEPNKFAGFRTKWTFADETVWKLTHEFGAKTMVVGGVLAALAGVLVPGAVGFWLAFAALMLGATLPVPYSWMLHRARHG